MVGSARCLRTTGRVAEEASSLAWWTAVSEGRGASRGTTDQDRQQQGLSNLGVSRACQRKRGQGNKCGYLIQHAQGTASRRPRGAAGGACGKARPSRIDVTSGSHGSGYSRNPRRRPTASRVLDNRRRKLGQLAEQTGHASPGDGFDGPLLYLPGAHGDGDALDGVLPRALLPFVAPSLTSRRLPPRAALLRSARIEPRGARPAAE